MRSRAKVINVSRGVCLAESAEVADTSVERRRGLLGRTGLADGEGLWIVPCQAIHMFGMKFSIDALFLDRKRKVVQVSRNVKPWRIAVCLTAHSVLELPAGAAERTGTARGDQLKLEKVGDR